jgi:hypothetical protein
MLARTCTLDVQGGAIARHQVAVSWTAAPTATGRGGRDGAADETAGQQDSGSNPAPQDFWVSLQLISQQSDY